MSAAKRLTLVSGLFDIAGRERNPRRRPADEFLRDGTLLMELDQDVVVFADPELAPRVQALRDAAGVGARTRVVAVALEDLPAHLLHDRIAAARSEHPVLNANPDKDTVLFTELQWSKFELVRRAIELDPFGASHYAWIDFVNRGDDPHPDDPLFERPSDRVRLLAMRGFRAEELADREDYYAYLRGHLAAGYITADRDRFLRLAEEFDSLARSELDAGFAPSEEQLLPVLCAQEPELFEFHYGDYSHLLANYLQVRGSAGNLLFQLRNARAEGDFGYANEIGGRVVAAQRAGTLECEPEVLADLLDEAFVAAWRVGGSRSPEAAEIAALYAELVRTVPAFRDAFLRNEIRIRANFEYLPLDRRPWSA